MVIKGQSRGGVRNVYERKERKPQLKVVNVTEMLEGVFFDRLKELFGPRVNFEFHKTPMIPKIHKNSECWAYKTEFYPLDVSLSLREVADFCEASQSSDMSLLPKVVKEMVDEHVSNIEQRFNRIKNFHPNSNFTIAFSPADALVHEGETAKAIYGFLVIGKNDAEFQSESSFVIISDSQPNKLTGEYDD